MAIIEIDDVRYEVPDEVAEYIEELHEEIEELESGVVFTPDWDEDDVEATVAVDGLMETLDIDGDPIEWSEGEWDNPLDDEEEE